MACGSVRGSVGGMPNVAPWLIGSGLAFGCLLMSLRALRRQRLLEDMPTSKTTGVFIGLVELKGTAECALPLTSYLAEQPCVRYGWGIEEHWSRIVTEFYKDANGQPQTRTRMETGWASVANGGESMPFYLCDDCGSILVWPDGAKIEDAQVFSETFRPSHPYYYGKGPDGAVANSTHERRFHETAIPLHAPLFVVGRARERKDVVAAEIAQAEGTDLFLISTRDEEQVRHGYAAGRWWWILGGWILLMLGYRLFEKEKGNETQIAAYVLNSLAYFAAMGAGWLWTVFNSLVGLRQNVRRGWATIEVQLQRRHDLIPRLVEIVAGLRDHEHHLQAEVAALRSQAMTPQPGVAGGEVRGCAPSLMAIVERYPELKAEESFVRLQSELVDTEQRIALARGYFNDIATFYNTRLQVVPDRFVAQLAGMQAQGLLAATELERAAVSVTFAK